MQTENDISHYPKCQAMMRRIEKHNTIRIVSVLILLFLNIPMAITPLATSYGIVFVIFALLYTAGTFISFLFADPETIRFCAIPAILVLLGLFSGWIFFPFAILLLVILLWVSGDYKKLKWLKTQTGYPHFNTRFDDQMQSFQKEYQSEYHFDHIHDAEMKDAFDEIPAEEKQSTAQAVEMPDAPDIPEGDE